MKKFLLAIVLVLSAGASMAQNKIAHINTQAVLDTMPERIEAIESLQKFETAGIQELKEMQADLQAAYEYYEANVNDWSPVIRKIEEDKIGKKEQAFQERQRSLDAEMQAYSNELNAPILEKVQKAVESVAKAKKFDYVVDASVMLYANGEDITDAVITEVLK